MPEDRDALLAHYRDGRARIEAAINGLTDAQLTETTLDGWSVKDHLAHLAFWDDVRAAEVERISAGHQSAWKMTDEQDEALNVLGYELRRELPLAQVRWECAQSRERLLSAIEAAPPQALEPSLYGAAGLRTDHEFEHARWIESWRGRGRGA
jgi:hypothetical protein